jgi:hypothetical protein
MKAHSLIDAGVCGFHTTVVTTSRWIGRND